MLPREIKCQGLTGRARPKKLPLCGKTLRAITLKIRLSTKSWAVFKLDFAKSAASPPVSTASFQPIAASF